MSGSQYICKRACTQGNICALQKHLVSGETQSVIYKSRAVKTLKVFLCWILKMRSLFALSFSATLLVLIAIHGADSGTPIRRIVPELPDLSALYMPPPYPIVQGKLRLISLISFFSRFLLLFFVFFFLTTELNFLSSLFLQGTVWQIRVSWEIKWFLRCIFTTCYWKGLAHFCRGLHMRQVAHQLGAHPGFCSIKRLGVFLLPPR